MKNNKLGKSNPKSQSAYLTRHSCIPAKSGFHESQFICSLCDIWNHSSNSEMGLKSLLKCFTDWNILTIFGGNFRHANKVWKCTEILKSLITFLFCCVHTLWGLFVYLFIIFRENGLDLFRTCGSRRLKFKPFSKENYLITLALFPCQTKFH